MTSVAASGRAELASMREQQVRRLIDQLSYLPTALCVAMRIIDLGKDPDAGPQDYAKVISSDASLSSKLLALANSSWFGVRRKVTTVSMAVNLLGLANVRALAISYCVTGLNHELDLSAEAAQTYWEAALCKGTAAKIYLNRVEPAADGDEALLAGLFQDLALPVMHTVAGEAVFEGLHDSEMDIDAQLELERSLFGLDHTAVGRMIAEKLELPELYIDVITFHHRGGELARRVEPPPLGEAVAVSAAFPHVHDAWRNKDRSDLMNLLHASESRGCGSPDDFLDAVQQEFDRLYAFFEGGSKPDLRLHQLMANATRAMADTTMHMVGQINALMSGYTSGGAE